MNHYVSVGILFILSPLFRFFHRLRLNHQSQPVVLVWYTGKLGDLVCLSGVMKAFKETRPNHRLILIARAPFTDILANNPSIDEVISFRADSQLKSFSWVYDVWKRLSSYPVVEIHVLVEHLESVVAGLWYRCSQRHVLITVGNYFARAIARMGYREHPFPYTTRIKHWYLSEFAGVEPSDEHYPNEVFFPGSNTEVDRAWSEAGMEQCKNIIGVLPSSGKDFKRWPEEYWKALIQKFDKLDYGIVLFGAGKEERVVIDRLHQGIQSHSMKIVNAPLQTVPYYLRKCSLVVGVDTGLIYIADALGVPVVDIMGPVDETHQRPEHEYVLVNNNEACPRVLQTPPRDLLGSKQFQQIRHCFESITVEQVFDAYKEMLDKKVIEEL